MGILNLFFGRNRLMDMEGQRTRQSPLFDPSHPDHMKRYWTAKDIDWATNVVGIQVRDTAVYLLRSDGEELIATRPLPETAYGYAKAMAERRHRSGVQLIPWIPEVPEDSEAAAA